MNLSAESRSRETAERAFFGHPKYALRFWSRVQKADGCWPWIGSRSATGYGRYSVHSYPLYAHRLAYRLSHGDIPVGMVVCHRCDNPPCVNPAHLFVGTPSDNERDKVSRGRKPPVTHTSKPGSSNPAAKLSESDVVAIRKRLGLGAKQATIAVDFSVSPSTISHIATGRKWA